MSVQAVSRHFKLGLDSWKPTDVPVPENTMIFADGSEENLLNFIQEVYSHTYDIKIDHDELKKHPGEFEAQRGNYRLRREPAAFSVRLYNDDGKYRSVLEALGFSVLGDSCF